MPAVRIRGCGFHLRKALRTNLGRLRLIKKLKKDNAFRHSFNLFGALAYVPVDDVQPLFQAMLAEPKFHPELKPFANDYYQPTWIQNRNGGEGKYKKKIWNLNQRLD